ncbi:hypothetical protein AB0E08_08495 [Streptomyces sp. NPDC048281]|uniref:hypothetical protein n=1 Tax=Streptomyces sp. NPDC048281 TaxID=3154715 RepID=UPI00342FC141
MRKLPSALALLATAALLPLTGVVVTATAAHAEGETYRCTQIVDLGDAVQAFGCTPRQSPDGSFFLQGPRRRFFCEEGDLADPNQGLIVGQGCVRVG